MAISTLFPTTRPSLSLDFAKSKRLDPRISFSRTTTGNIASYTDSNGLIRYAGPDEPRFDHDPATGESLGLLVEEGRTNIFNWSESYLAGQGFGGIGTLNSDTIINPTGSSGTVHYITTSEWYKTFDADQATSLAISFFSKKRFGGLERDYNTFEFYQVAVAGGSIGFYSFRYDGNNPDTTYVKNVRTISYPNGWYRFEFQLLPRADYNGGVFSTSTRIDMEGSSSDNYIWGIQVEKDKTFSTSYIPTTTTTVTRPADNISITGTKFSEWYNQVENSVVCQYKINSSSIVRIFNIDNGTETSRISGLAGSTLYQTFVNPGATGPSISINNTNFQKIASGHKDNNVTIYGNYSFTSSDTAITIPKNLTTFRIGNWHNLTLQGTTISKLYYYPSKLSNFQLQILTK